MNKRLFRLAVLFGLTTAAAFAQNSSFGQAAQGVATEMIAIARWIGIIVCIICGFGLAFGESQGRRRVWIILDELVSLQTLPQLHTAITESRKSGNPLVIGIQNMAQLEDLYGKKSETIFSQAYTKFVLPTTEPRSAKALSDLIGECEYRRIRETRSGSLLGRKDRNSYSGPEEVRKPLILPSEIQGLQNLHGYMVQRGLVVPIRLPYIQRPAIAPGLIERIIPPMEKRPLDPGAPGSGLTGVL